MLFSGGETRRIDRPAVGADMERMMGEAASERVERRPRLVRTKPRKSVQMAGDPQPGYSLGQATNPQQNAANARRNAGEVPPNAWWP